MATTATTKTMTTAKMATRMTRATPSSARKVDVRRGGVRARVASSPSGNNTNGQQQQRLGTPSSPSRVESLVLECVKAKSDLQWFENFAGRSAMLGFGVAIAFEGATGSSLFGGAGHVGSVGAEDPFLFFSRSSGWAALLLLVIFSRASLKSQRLPLDVRRSLFAFGNDGEADDDDEETKRNAGFLDKVIDDTLASSFDKNSL